jgi:hypothetical protein
MLGPDWGFILDISSPLAVDRATKQLSIETTLSQLAVTRADASATRRARIVMSFPTKGKSGAPRRRATCKRSRATTVEPL